MQLPPAKESVVMQAAAILILDLVAMHDSYTQQAKHLKPNAFTCSLYKKYSID